MLNELLTLTICALSGAGSLDIREPSRANNEPNFTLYNDSGYTIQAYCSSQDEEYLIETGDKLSLFYTYHADDWKIIVEGYWDDFNSMWFEVLDSISTPQYPEWDYNAAANQSYFSVTGQTSVATGIGIYKVRYFDPTTDYYIDPTTWGGIQKGQRDWRGEISIVPQNANNIRIYKDDGTYNTATELKVKRAPVDDKSTLYASLVYAKISGAYINIANNYGFTDLSVGYAPLPTDITKYQPYLLYQNHYTNKVRLINCEMTKSPEQYPDTGYQPGVGYLSEENPGYLTYQESGQTEGFDALAKGFELVMNSFAAVAPIFSYMVFPGITVGFLFLIPLLITLTFAMIKLIKKG